MIIRCTQCNGRKKILSLGNMIKDCSQCRGLGHIEEKKEELELKSPALDSRSSSITDVINTSPASIKKRGRKKKTPYQELLDKKQSLIASA